MLRPTYRSWNTLCEKLHDDKIQRELRRQAKKNGQNGARQSRELRSSADMLRAATRKPNLPAGRGSLDAGQRKKGSTARSSLDMGQAARGGLARQWSAIKDKGMSALRKTSNKDNSEAAAASEASAEQVTEFPMWGKKAVLDDTITEEYLAGRDMAGQAFVEVFSRLNPWAVRDFDYGLSTTHAAKMGLALELIVSGATKPLTLQQRLRVLALGHVQMGIKPEMFPSFEKALFEFLNEVPCPHCRRLRQFPLLLRYAFFSHINVSGAWQDKSLRSLASAPFHCIPTCRLPLSCCPH